MRLSPRARCPAPFRARADGWGPPERAQRRWTQEQTSELLSPLRSRKRACAVPSSRTQPLAADAQEADLSKAVSALDKRASLGLPYPKRSSSPPRLRRLPPAGASQQSSRVEGAPPELSARLAQIDLQPARAKTLLVTQACPPQMVQARGSSSLWALPQFELMKLVGSGKTSNVYQARLPPPRSPRPKSCDG